MLASTKGVPRIALALGGGGLIPFAFYAAQHDALLNKGRGSGAPWGDALLARWQRHTGLPLSHFACGDQATVRRRFTAYSACILSFLGAVHWGPALAGASPVAGRQLVFGVLPSLLAWSALCAPGDFGGSRAGTGPYTILCAGFLASFYVDNMAASLKPVAALPPAYILLRAPLTCAVVMAHCVAGVLSREPSVSD